MEDPEPSDRVSEEVQLKAGMAEDREPLTPPCTSVPAPLAPAQASAGWNQQDPAKNQQTKDKEFICSLPFPSTSCWQPGKAYQLKSDGLTMNKHLILFKNVIQRRKNRTDYILESTFITICMLICICKYIYMYVCMCRDIGHISHLCLNWRWQRNFSEHQSVGWDYIIIQTTFHSLHLSDSKHASGWNHYKGAWSLFPMDNSVPCFSGITYKY